MPVSSISALNSWGVYVFSAFALVLLFEPALVGLYHDSGEWAGMRTAEGLRAVIDGLSPGLVANISFTGGVTSDAFILSGYTISCTCGNGTVSLHTRYPLQASVLEPSSSYVLWLQQGVVEVAQAG